MGAEKPASFDMAHGLARMRERTRQAREHEAERLFGPDNLAAVLSAAAALGQSAADFSPSVPMDLSETSAGKAMKETLEAAGFLVEWKRSRPSPDAEPCTVLRVSWGADAAQRSR